MSKRFSIEGRGAELFFGEEPITDSGHRWESEPEPTARQTDIQTSRQAARKTDSKTARQTARQTAGKTDSKTARQTDNWDRSRASMQEHRPEIVQRLRAALMEAHPVHNTFRYAQSDLDAVRDIVYELEVQRQIKTSRNDVMRLALSWILDDYREHGDDSLLVAVLKEERWRPPR